MATVLPHCIATATRLVKDRSIIYERGSDVESIRCWPRCQKKDRASCPTPPPPPPHLLHSYWYKLVAGFEVGVLGPFLPLCLLHHCFRFPCSNISVGGCKSVWAGGIPHEHLPTLPCMHEAIETPSGRLP